MKPKPEWIKREGFSISILGASRILMNSLVIGLHIIIGLILIGSLKQSKPLHEFTKPNLSNLGLEVIEHLFLELTFTFLVSVGGSLLKVEEALQSSKTKCRGRWRRGRLEQSSEIKYSGRWWWSMKMVIKGEIYDGLIVVEKIWWKLQRQFWELFK